MPITIQPAPLEFERSATLEIQQAAGPTQLSRSDDGSHGKGPQVSSGGGRPPGRGELSERPQRREPTQLGPSDDQNRGERPRRPSVTTTELSQEEQSSSSVRYRPPVRAVPSEHASATTEPPRQGHNGPSTTPHRPPAPTEHTASRQDRRDPSAIQYGLRDPSSVPHRLPVPQEPHAMRELPSSFRQGREPSATTPHWPVLPEQGRDEPIATQSRLELNRRLLIQESPGPIQVTPSDDGPSEQPRGGTMSRGRPRQPEPQSGPPVPQSDPQEQCCLCCLRFCCILVATNDSGPPAYDNDSGPHAYIVEIETSPPSPHSPQEQSYPTPSVVPQSVQSSHHHLPTSERQPSVSTQPRHRPPMSIRTQHESPNGCRDCCRDCYNGCCDCCRGCYNGCCDCCRGCYNGCCDCFRDCYNGCRDCCRDC